MATTPDPNDPSRASSEAGANPFAGLGAGLGFFQDWMKAASSAVPNLGPLAGASSATGTAWTMPTLDPDEIDKRIQELKTVQFWLEQNARMLAMTVQGLEVQRMTLQTLRDMKVPLEALKESLQARPAPTQAPASPSVDASGTNAGPEAAAAVNPMQWWSALTQQFSTLASQAVQAGQEAMAARQRPVPGAEGAEGTGQEGSDDAPGARGSASADAPQPSGGTRRPPRAPKG